MSRRKTGSLMVAGPPRGAEIDRGILELLHRCAWPCDLDRRASFFWHRLAVRVALSRLESMRSPDESRPVDMMNPRLDNRRRAG